MINEMKIQLKIVKTLKFWEDADIFQLKVKKLIAEHIVEEIKDMLPKPPERGL